MNNYQFYASRVYRENIPLQYLSINNGGIFVYFTSNSFHIFLIDSIYDGI